MSSLDTVNCGLNGKSLTKFSLELTVSNMMDTTKDSLEESNRIRDLQKNFLSLNLKT